MTTLTRHRDLRTGAAVWAGRPSRGPASARLTADLDTDVLVVGAGISGALISELLATNGFRVVIVDRRGVALGSTAASTSLIQYEIDEPLTVLAAKIGEVTATRAWRRSHQAVANLAARTDQLGIECARQSRPSLYLAGDQLDARGIVREGEARREAGFETDILTRSELRQTYGIRRPAALRGYGNYGADPVRLAKGYLKAAVAAGARLYAPVEIAALNCRARSATAITKEGLSIKCRTVVFATGYEFPDFVPLEGHRLISTFALATRRQRRRLWAEECLISEAADPYLYLRTTADGRAVIGGEDEEFVDAKRRDAALERKVKDIGKKARRLFFAELDVTPDFAWAGTFGASNDGLPTIGEVPNYRNCWACLGYGGNGITFSRLAAEIIRTTLTGGVDPDADVFKFRVRG